MPHNGSCQSTCIDSHTQSSHCQPRYNLQAYSQHPTHFPVPRHQLQAAILAGTCRPAICAAGVSPCTHSHRPGKHMCLTAVEACLGSNTHVVYTRPCTRSSRSCVCFNITAASAVRAGACCSSSTGAFYQLGATGLTCSCTAISFKLHPSCTNFRKYCYKRFQRTSTHTDQVPVLQHTTGAQRPGQCTHATTPNHPALHYSQLGHNRQQSKQQSFTHASCRHQSDIKHAPQPAAMPAAPHDNLTPTPNIRL
jgi:hypothetical protein